MAATYAWEGVEALLDGDLVTPPTRAALRARLDGRTTPPTFLSPELFAVLQAVCARLAPQPKPDRQVDLAGLVDARLATGPGDGWRYDALPADGEAYRLGLLALNQAAQTLGGSSFAALDGADQDRLIERCQRGELGDASWAGEPCALWFEELLAEVAEHYYAHPFAQDAIGYAGMADARGWTAVGLDQREPPEPAEIMPPEAR